MPLGPCLGVYHTKRSTLRQFIAAPARQETGQKQPGRGSLRFPENDWPQALFREFYVPFMDISPGVVGFEGCESLCPHQRNRKAVAGKYVARHLSGIRQALGNKELCNVYRLP